MTSPAPDPTPGTATTASSSPTAYRRARRMLGRLRRRVVDPTGLTARHEKLRSRVERHATRLAETKTVLAQVRKDATTTTTKLTALTKRVRTVELATIHRDREHDNLTIQVGLCEERLGRIEEQLRAEPLTTSPAEEVEARSLLAEVRREHERIRVRMQVIGQYEERLRRVEAAVVDMHGDDVRHPI